MEHNPINKELTVTRLPRNKKQRLKTVANNSARRNRNERRQHRNYKLTRRAELFAMVLSLCFLFRRSLVTVGSLLIGLCSLPIPLLGPKGGLISLPPAVFLCRSRISTRSG